MLRSAAMVTLSGKDSVHRDAHVSTYNNIYCDNFNQERFSESGNRLYKRKWIS